MESLIQLRQVSVKRSGKMILKDVSLDVPPNKFITIIGPNGSGKTTLIRVMLELTQISSGTIIRRRNLSVGYVPQKIRIDHALPLKVCSFLNLLAPAERVGEVLSSVGAAHLLNCSVHHLSGGEFQRVLLAQALINKPDLLVLDEPLQGVDVLGQEALYTLISETQKTLKCTIVLISHDLHYVHTSSDQVICLNGHVCCAGKPDEIKENPNYRALFEGSPLNTLAPYRHDQHHQHAHDHMHEHDNHSKGCNHE